MFYFLLIVKAYLPLFNHCWPWFNIINHDDPSRPIPYYQNMADRTCWGGFADGPQRAFQCLRPQPTCGNSVSVRCNCGNWITEKHLKNHPKWEANSFGQSPKLVWKVRRLLFSCSFWLFLVLNQQIMGLRRGRATLCWWNIGESALCPPQKHTHTHKKKKKQLPAKKWFKAWSNDYMPGPSKS